jgi:hypothetical protein
MVVLVKLNNNNKLKNLSLKEIINLCRKTDKCSMFVGCYMYSCEGGCPIFASFTKDFNCLT